MTAAASPPRSQAREQRRRRLCCLLVALACAVALLVPATPAVAQSESDTSAPTLAGAERGNATTIVVTVADDTDVAESSISVSDFSISTGLLANATVNESGTNATVNLLLVDPVNADNVTVSLDGSISDATGNTVSTGEVTATGMDGVDPRLLDFSVDRLNGTHARLGVETVEPLSQLTLAIGSANTANLDIDNFTETRQNDGNVRYTRVHEFDNEGETLVLLMKLTDEAGNTISYNARRDYLVDRTPPTADIDGPTFVTAGDNHTFDSGATDNVGVESVRWSIGNNTTLTGQSITHAFTAPGNTTLTATVTDGRGRNVTVDHTVTVAPGGSTDGVDVIPVSSNRTNATVFGDRDTQRVRIAGPRGELVSNDGVTIESLRATPPAGEPLRLSLALNRSARSFTTATGRPSITSFSVTHPVRDTATNVTVSFAIDHYRLQSSGIDHDSVSLYRLNGTWTELPTRVRYNGTDRVHFTADSPGLSAFAIGASGQADVSGNETETNGTGDGGTVGDRNDTDESGGNETVADDDNGTDASPPAPASLVVTNATLVADPASTGGYAIVTATVANTGGQTGSRTLTLTVNNTTVETRPVTVPAGENRTIQFATRTDESGPLAVDDVTAGTAGNETMAGPMPEATPTDNVTATPTASTATPNATTTASTENATASNTTTTAATTTASATVASTATQTAQTTPETATNATQQGGRGLPNPLSLLPGGLVVTVLGAVVGLAAVAYGVLKALAIYLGY